MVDVLWHFMVVSSFILTGAMLFSALFIVCAVVSVWIDFIRRDPF